MSRDPALRAALRQLLRRQSEEAIRFSAIFGDTHRLHQTDVAALTAIAEASRAGSPLGPARLAETLRLSRPATTALLDRLEAGGHIQRHPDPSDRRRTLVELQPRAQQLASEFFGALGDAYSAVMADFEDDELETVASFLEAIIRATIDTGVELAPPTDV